MLKEFSELRLTHTAELLQMYRAVIINGCFQRDPISDYTHMKPAIVEGRWYGEINRTKKFGAEYDWKTKLYTMVHNQILNKNKDTQIIDKLIAMLESRNMFTMDVLDLIDSNPLNSSKVITQIASGENAPDSTVDLFNMYDNFFDQ
uniref:Uncharacterized protein n=1 Tax=Trepomonas sp. PC1 TaxID=1076344 RepID=A0A146KGZ9_9EUKA|eukprot:JAP94529.1 Hypothetical protein TPC1_12786 [Trepomonas sp. PC1]